MGRINSKSQVTLLVTIAAISALLAAYSLLRIALLALRIEFKTPLVIVQMARSIPMVFLLAQVINLLDLCLIDRHY